MATWIGAVSAAAAAAFTIAAGGQTPPSTTQTTSTPPPSASPTTPSTQIGSGQSPQSGSGQAGQTSGGQAGRMGSGESQQPGSGQSSEQMGNGQSGRMQPSPSPTPTAQGTHDNHLERISVPLQAMPAGTVTLSVDPRTHLVRARLNMFGLAPGTQHRVAVYEEREGGRPAFTFPDVTADGTGRVQQVVTSTQTARRGLPLDLFFRVDLLPSQNDGGGQQIAVAHRSVSGTRFGFQTLTFESTIADPGHAQLTYDPATQKLTVTLRVSDLAPGSTHAAHIHTGSCAAQGPVVYPLPDLVANGNGSAFEQTTISVQSPPPATGWYVNVHDGNMNNILQANGQPGPLFQPLVCGNVHATSTHS